MFSVPKCLPEKCQQTPYVMEAFFFFQALMKSTLIITKKQNKHTIARCVLPCCESWDGDFFEIRIENSPFMLLAGNMGTG